MADDLKLEIVIQALLDAKGFEEAKANIAKVADTANTAAPQVKKLGESFGGTRGPVADVTRVLLMNTGVTGAAGEAAKAAGTAMYFLEGAATASAVAITGGVAVLALLLPMLIEWIADNKEVVKSQENFNEALGISLERLREYIAKVPNATSELKQLFKVMTDEAARKQKNDITELDKSMGSLRQQIAQLNAPVMQLEKSFARGGGALVENRAATEANRAKAAELSDELARQQVKMNALLAAMYDETTISHQVEKALDDQDKARTVTTRKIGQQTDAVKKLTEAEKFALQQEEDARLDIIAFTQKQDAKRKKDAAAETKLLLDRMELEREEARQAADVAELKKQLQLAAVGYAGQAFTALAELFGRNKALAIAGAIADTYAGAALALRTIPPPAGWAAAAATIAQGMVAVQNIRKAEPVGFDDPFSDMTARQLGRKSAVDFVQNFGSEFIPGVRGGMRGMGGSSSTTINRGVTNNITAHGIIGSKTEFRKWLAREITVAERVEGRRSLGR